MSTRYKYCRCCMDRFRRLRQYYRHMRLVHNITYLTGPMEVWIPPIGTPYPDLNTEPCESWHRIDKPPDLDEDPTSLFGLNEQLRDRNRALDRLLPTASDFADAMHGLVKPTAEAAKRVRELGAVMENLKEITEDD